MKILPAFEIIIEYHISWTDQCDFMILHLNYL